MYRLAWEISENVSWEPTTGCALWLGEVYPSGYGRLGTSRDPWGGYAHRATLYFQGVSLDGGHSKHVRHICDNPACVNPRHLAYGAARENMLDRERRYARGEIVRHRPLAGEKHARAKLSDAQVVALRARYAAGERGTDLAREFGIAPSTFYGITAGRSRMTASGGPHPTQNAA
jgi:hypothetical protein